MYPYMQAEETIYFLECITDIFIGNTIVIYARNLFKILNLICEILFLFSSPFYLKKAP